MRAPLVDAAYGNRRRDWAVAERVAYPAEIRPVSSTEDVVNQQETTTRFRLTQHPEPDLLSTDRVEWNGSTFEVDGDVEPWTRRGQLHHLEAVLLRVTLEEG
ncbi:head-tail adaptor protein [Micromonospora sp. NPDC000207]|uniref:phage head completion protein n=1 Tax=Micromonospora sp. NPDC000207 TaxID=3154246 RepID=UPI00332FDE31